MAVRHPKNIALAGLGVLFAAFCWFGTAGEGGSSEDAVRPKMAFFYTGELLGELEPCGCSGDKLGGMLLRSGWVEAMRSRYERLYLVDGGFALPAEGGSPDRIRQGQIKFEHHHRMLRQMRYDARFLSEREAPLPDPVPMSLCAAARWHATETSESSGQVRKVLFLAIEDGRPDPKAIEAVIAQERPDVVFALARGHSSQCSHAVPVGDYLAIVLLVDSPEPFSPLRTDTGLLVASAGNRGRYAGLLEIEFGGKKASDWNCRILPLTSEFPESQAIRDLLVSYQEQVKTERLLDMRIREISPIGFVGSDVCQICHSHEYEQWSQKAHAHAFATLEKVNHHYDPECVGCHVVGFEYEEGFRSLDETPHLKDVGCEACHGAGAYHVVETEERYGAVPDGTGCLTCHQPTRTPHFEYSEYREKIRHWTED